MQALLCAWGGVGWGGEQESRQGKRRNAQKSEEVESQIIESVEYPTKELALYSVDVRNLWRLFK